MWRRNVRAVIGALGVTVLLAALIVYGLSRGQAKPLDSFGDAPRFKLIDQLGRPVNSDEFHGKVVVADFMYTHCPDVCPLLSLQMQGLQERLLREKLLGSRVQLLSFTVDPARDTPPVLRQYAERYHADPLAWRFLSGPEAEVQPMIQKGFLLGVQKVAPQATSEHDADHGDGAYDMMHSTRFVLIDRQGRMRAFYDGRELDLDQVVRDIRQLLR